MSNLDDYNWHKTVGPAAGAPSSIGGFIGQQDHQRENQRQPYYGSGSQESTPGKPPRWLVTHPIRRGLYVSLVSYAATLITNFMNSKNDIVEFISALAIFGSLFGFLWMTGGFIAFLAARKKN